jgi:intein/homing endonuclease
MEFQSKSKEWLENLRKMVKKYSASKSSIKEIPLSKGKYWKLALNDKNFVRFLFDISDFQTPQSTWKTPKIILSSSWRIKKAYISGFFDAEGCVTKLTFREIWNIGFYHTWQNENECPPLEDIKSMLAGIDIRTNRITVKTKNRKTPLFTFRITDKKSVHKFCNQFQAFNPDKK